ncbi:diguanylate cyclase [Clostridium sp. P21]|uniref:Diguanylate cyclase n=1 Tax=Clostridium muellerianum TaxID=2716538 RepID=A0A7Y0HQD7_9CLOT|nr:sensor domain-containing diguanylate cyclase [Clostridium muellerianum]NMM63678.1 diguanylate cyclase [Clostridium muellerianum]
MDKNIEMLVVEDVFENAIQRAKELEDTNIKLKKAFKTIKKLEKNYRAILESSKDALVVINYDKEILYLNPASKKLFGQNYKELIIDILNFDEIENSDKEITINYLDGNKIIANMCISEINWESKQAYLLSIRDVTDEVRLRERFKIQSLTDELTQLYNRRGFLSLVENKIEIAKCSKKSVTLFFIDIDGMKDINDKLSHNYGDYAIIGASTILKETFGENDIVARIGGDEFAILAMDVDEYEAKRIINKIMEKQKDFNRNNEYCFNVSMSIGTAYFNSEEPININELMEKADKKMYENKKNKRVQRN